MRIGKIGKLDQIWEVSSQNEPSKQASKIGNDWWVLNTVEMDTTYWFDQFCIGAPPSPQKNMR